jgi:hypothetical protein
LVGGFCCVPWLCHVVLASLSLACGGDGLSFIDPSLTRSGPQYDCTHMETEHDRSGGKRLVNAKDLAASLLLIRWFGPQLVVSLFASISAAPHKGLMRKRLGCRMSPDTDVEGDIECTAGASLSRVHLFCECVSTKHLFETASRFQTYSVVETSAIGARQKVVIHLCASKAQMRRYETL